MEQTTASYSVSRTFMNGGRRLGGPAVEVPTSSPATQTPSNSPGGGGLQSLDPTVVIIMVVLLFALICAAFLNSLMRCMMRRRMQARNARAMFIGRPGEQDSEQGLDAKTLASLPVLTFKQGESSKASKPTALECTICLSEFMEDERLRLLPKCTHVFHLDCIDMWLLSHVSCPVCRSAIEEVHTLTESGEESAESGDVMLLVRDSAGNASVRRSTGARVIEPGEISARNETFDVRAELTRDKSWNSLTEAARISNSRPGSRRLTTGSREGSTSRSSFRAAINSILTSSDNVFSGRKSTSASVPRLFSDSATEPAAHPESSARFAGSMIELSPTENSSLAANDQLSDRLNSSPLRLPPATK